ncbi:MAG: hypothetical protein HY665_08165 [Chloroflexi bacterium]|nr:hypothetical protein [Chloroflexota bacterium]
MDAEYSFSMLRFYYDEITRLLHDRAAHFRQYTDELDEAHKKRGQPFDKAYWLKHYDVYSEYYPHIFRNTFLVSACGLFESHLSKLCALVKTEHESELGLDDMEKASVLTKARRFLAFAGIALKDAPPDAVQTMLATIPPYHKELSWPELWEEIENYYRLRNCVAHHNGCLERMRHYKKVRAYASARGILPEGSPELSLTDEFNREACAVMGKFFFRLMSAYYSTPLPE